VYDVGGDLLRHHEGAKHSEKAEHLNAFSHGFAELAENNQVKTKR
jgi:hypothetical protein